MVALYLHCAVHLAEQPLRLAHRVAQRLAYQGCVLVLSDGESYRVVGAWVKHHFKRQPVGVGHNAFLVALLVEQLHVPSVQCPEEERTRRRAALHLHRLVRPVQLFAPSVTIYEVVAFVAPHGHGGRGDLLPVHLCRHHVVELRHLCVVEVARVGHEAHQDGLVLLRGHLRGVLQPCGEVLVHQGGVAHLAVFLVFALQRPRVLGQAARPFVVVEALHGLADLVPETGGLAAEGLALGAAVLNQAAYGVEHDGVGVVHRAHVHRKVASVGQREVFEPPCGLRRVLDQALQHVVLGRLAGVAHLLDDRFLEAVGKAVVGYQRRSVATGTANHLDVLAVMG